jgi:diaminopimelate decarboxylase
MKKEIKEEIFSKIIKSERAAFLIDQKSFEDNLSMIHSAFISHYPKVTIGYSYKTNYIPLICKSAHEKGCWAEVVSEMEVEMALCHLCDKSHIIYNGPIKSAESIQKVIEVGGIINIDHLLDIHLIEKIIVKMNYTNKKVRIALRLNFGYESNESRFGIELEKIKDFIEIIEKNPAFDLLGYHLHLPFRSLESYKFRIDCFFDVLSIHGGRKLDYINIGGGFYGRISSELAESLELKNVPDYKDYGQLIGNKFSEYFKKFDKKAWPNLFIEPGSSVVADALWFISRIHTYKQIANKNILVTYAGRHLISPTNKTILFPVELYKSLESELCLTKDDLFVVGYTCIESDVIGKINSEFVSHNQDFIAISNVGSYSIVMGSDFILPQPAIFNYIDGELKLVRRTKSTNEILNTFI